jgi:sugar/nucleoside kinase (ribokinase family)
MTDYDIVALGDINMDYVVAGNLAFPFSSILTNGLIYWEEIDEVPGGSGLNFCSFAAEAGYRCLLLGRVGNDSAGEAIARWLTKRHVEFPQHWGTPTATGRALILRDSDGIRLIINNRNNANHALNAADIERNLPASSSSRVLYVSGYCLSDPQTARYNAAIHAMAHVRSGPRPPTIVFDVAPHRIYERLSFEEFRECTRHVDILISEVATMRRFLGVGSSAEKIDLAMAQDTAERMTTDYSRVVMRYGPSGCDEEILIDKNAGRFLHQATSHDQVGDKRGYGDRLALCALRDFFQVLPAY